MRKKVKMIKQSIGLCIAVMLVGCSDDLYENENSFNSKGVKFSKVSLKDPQFLNKQQLLLEVNKIKNKNATSLAGRMVYDSINHFYFDDEKGMLVETINGYESYTFKVERQTPVDSKLENIIFSKNQEGGFDTFLAKYPYSEEQMKTLSSQAFENMQTEFQMLNRAMAILCVTLTTYGNCNETHSNGVTCDAESVIYDCYNMDSDGGGGSIDYSGTGSNSGSGTSWEGGGTVSTTPIYNTSGSNTTAPKNPCAKLKKLFDPTKANIKPSLIALQNTITPTGGENAVNFKKDANGNYSTTTVPQTNGNSIVGEIGPDVYGEAHTHTLDLFPMFSWTDVNRLLELSSNTSPANLENVVNMVVVKDDFNQYQVYALVYDDSSIGANTVESALNQPELNGCSKREKLNVYDELLGKKFENDSNYERDFLRQFFGFNVSLYKANADLSNWSKLSLNSITANVDTTPCN